MTQLADAALRRLTYKAHTSADIDPSALAVLASDPAATGGQVIPYVPGLVFDIDRPETESKERRADLMQFDTRLGRYRGNFTIPFELQCKTYQDFFAAVTRGTWAAVAQKGDSDFTSLAATASSSKFTVGASTWAAQSFKVGYTFRPANFPPLSTLNYLIRSMSGVDAVVSPAPSDVSADLNFNIDVPGKVLVAPEAGSLTLRKFCFEDWIVDSDYARVHSEARFGGVEMTIPVEGNVTGRWLGAFRTTAPYTGASAPFFASPTATSDQVKLALTSGYVLYNGAAVATITGATLRMMIGAAPVIAGGAGQPYVADITGGQLVVNGDLNAVFFDGAFQTAWLAETEFELAFQFFEGTATTSEFMTFYMPRVKLTKYGEGDPENGPIPLSMSFRALRKTTTTGFVQSPILIHDSRAT